MTTERINRIIDGVIAVEGGFVVHPDDPGGATKFGITERVARANGFAGNMRDLPRSTAFQIYLLRYVVAPNFDDVALIDDRVAEELIDSGVNAGPGRAVKWFQEGLNLLNRKGADYPDIIVDGDLGQKSLAAFQALRRKRGAEGSALMLKLLDALQAEHYINLARKGQQFESFIPGWFSHRIGNAA